MKKILPIASCVAFFCASASAQISGVNAGTSSATIKFNDTNSIVPPSGTTNVTQSIGPWNGALFTSAFPVDPNTADFATGDIQASGAGSVYTVGLNNIQLSQVLATSGYALLIYSFTIDYLITGSPLLAGNPTYYPNFQVSGTVGASVGSFAQVSGTINYYDISNAAYPSGLLDTVTYSYFNNTPGPFTNAPVTSAVSVGTTPLVPVGSTLTLVGSITFTVDPSTLTAQSYPAPEPTSGMLALLSAPLFLRRRRG